MNEQKINQLFVFKRKPSGKPGVRDSFEFHKRVVLKDMPLFKQVSMQFYFVNNSGKERNSIMFAKIDQIFHLNFDTEEITTIYKY